MISLREITVTTSRARVLLVAEGPASHHAAQFSTSFVPGYIIIVNLLPQRMQSNIDSDGGKSLYQRQL